MISRAQDSAKLELLRAVTFLWCGLSVLAALVGIFIQELWPHALLSLLFAGSIAGLMLDRLREPTIATLTILGFGVRFF